MSAARHYISLSMHNGSGKQPFDHGFNFNALARDVCLMGPIC